MKRNHFSERDRERQFIILGGKFRGYPVKSALKLCGIDMSQKKWRHLCVKKFEDKGLISIPVQIIFDPFIRRNSQPGLAMFEHCKINAENLIPGRMGRLEKDMRFRFQIILLFGLFFLLYGRGRSCLHLSLRFCLRFCGLAFSCKRKSDFVIVIRYQIIHGFF